MKMIIEEKIADNTYEIKIKEDNNKIKTVIIYRKQKENISLAIMVDADKNILPVGDKMPKLFISFPLIGSENFPFPIIINCQDLQPNETRSNIALVENEDSTDSKINKERKNKKKNLKQKNPKQKKIKKLWKKKKKRKKKKKK